MEPKNLDIPREELVSDVREDLKKGANALYWLIGLMTCYGRGFKDSWKIVNEALS